MGPVAVTGWLQPTVTATVVGTASMLAVAAVALVGAGAAVFWRRTGNRVEPAVDDDGQPAPVTDPEHVTGVLQENGGRMHQSAIVEATGWSKSKVSTVLSEMTDQGRVNKLRLGRENIISLPGHEPEAARSPYDRRG